MFKTSPLFLKTRLFCFRKFEIFNFNNLSKKNEYYTDKKYLRNL